MARLSQVRSRGTEEILRLTSATEIPPSGTRFPIRALVMSCLLHILGVVIMPLLPFAYMVFYPQAPLAIEPRQVIEDHEIVYVPLLPNVGPGGYRGGPEGASGASPTKTEGGKPSAGPQGLHYKGPQPIISDPPQPDNRLQTVRQPDLVKPPRLPFPLKLANQVLIARIPTVPVFNPPKPTIVEFPADKQVRRPTMAAQPVAVNPPSAIVEQAQAPKLLLAAVAEPQLAPRPKPAPANPQPATAPARQAPPSPSAVSAGGNDVQNLLIANAINFEMANPDKLPPGELSGKFVVGPGSATGTPSSAPGGTTPGNAAGEEGGVPASEGSGRSGTGKGNTGGGNGGFEGASDHGSGSGSSGTGPGSNEKGYGTGSGGGHGVGPGAGNGQGRGTGSGPGSGTPSGPFSGITITGGESSSGIASAQKAGNKRQHHDYDLTIWSNGSSGGGLKDYGVFRNETVFTVYVDVSEPGHPVPDLTMQYTLLRESNGAADPDPPGIAPTPREQGVISPPYPTTKHYPEFPPDAVRRNVGRSLVVYAIVDVTGEMKDVRVLQSPNPLLNQPVLDALAKWKFQPAEVNGKAVSVKTLLGVPITER